MAIAQSEQKLTLEEFLRLPEVKPALEFEDGVVTRKVSPSGKHTVLQYRFSERINQFSVPRNLAFAFPELRASFGRRSRVPDIAVYTWDRIPRDANGEIANDFRIPPDIAVEIASLGQSRPALIQRCRSFSQLGVRITLLIDPEDRSVRDFRPPDLIRLLGGSDVIDLGDVLPGFRMTVDELFGLLYL